MFNVHAVADVCAAALTQFLMPVTGPRHGRRWAAKEVISAWRLARGGGFSCRQCVRLAFRASVSPHHKVAGASYTAASSRLSVRAKTHALVL